MTDTIKQLEGGITAPKGFLASGVHCGIRKNKTKKDLALIYSKELCAAAAVYTQNKVKGAPIAVTRRHLENGYAKAVICNSGNANTCNADGEEKAEMMCEATAKALSISAGDVVVASTGVIGQPLPIEPILDGMDELVKNLSENGSDDAANAIMTTDTVKKEVAVSFMIGGVECRMGAIAKGSGMIHPNMATMLGFLTTDAAISPEMLQKALSEDIVDTYNMVSVDGDTSTNDMVCILANGMAKNKMITEEGEDFDLFKAALKQINTQIARSIAKDGEGATKLITCQVTGAASVESAKIVAKSVITSSLFKAAMFGADANWGRILCAIGYAKTELDIMKVDVDLSSVKGKIAVCRDGSGVDFSEEEAKIILSEDEVVVDVILHDGNGSATAWGCDLTYDYVKINGDYRT